MQISEPVRKEFSNFLVAYAPLFSDRIKAAIPTFNYGFGVDGVHFRATFSRSSASNGYELVFEESSFDPHTARISCSLAKDGSLSLITATNINVPRVERVFHAFQHTVKRSRDLLLKASQPS